MAQIILHVSIMNNNYIYKWIYIQLAIYLMHVFSSYYIHFKITGILQRNQSTLGIWKVSLSEHNMICMLLYLVV